MKMRLFLTCAMTLLFVIRVHAFEIEFRPGALIKSNNMPSTVNHTASGITVSFQLNSFHVNSFDKSADFQSVDFVGLNKTSIDGVASLPFTSVIVKARPEELHISVDKGEEFSFKEVTPAPYDEPGCRCEKDKLPEVFSVNEKSYLESRERTYEVQYLGDFRGIPLTRVLVYPAAYSAEKGLVAWPDLRLNIESENGALETVTSREEMEASLNKNYLVIGSSHLVDVLKEKWGPHRQAQGYNITWSTLEEVGNSVEEVRAHVAAHYQANKTSYVLFVGHEDNFPTHFAKTSNDDATPSDLIYVTMGGAGDFVPDIHAGRIVADNESEVRLQVEKILEYENRTWGNSSGLGKMVSIASNEGSNPTDVEYIQNMARPFEQTFGTTADYFLQDNRNSTVSNINDSLSGGAMWLNYIGHGSGTSWPSINRGSYNSTDIRDLRAGGVKPVIIDVACQNGRFSYEGRLGERFMNESKNGKPVGAVAYYGGSVDISWHPPAIMAVAINQKIVEKNITHLGSALLEGHLELMRVHSNQSQVNDNFTWYHLFGDPALNLRLQ